MPFDEAYREEFQPGDLVYGLKEPRAVWLGLHKAMLGKNWIDKFTVDMDSCDIDDAINIEFLTVTLSHPKYQCVVKTADHPRTTASKQHLWRTKSKAGLNWAVSTGKHVHFILDNLNMNEVASKTNTIGNADSPQGKATAAVTQADKVRTITNAELRWIYRNRQVPATQNHIQFWLNNIPCCPPWYPEWDSGVGKRVAGDVAWRAYVPTVTVGAV